MSCADELDDARSELAKLDAELCALNEEVLTVRSRNERLCAERKILDRRIHNQRLALRETWEIVEMRRKWLGSFTASKCAARNIRENRLLRAENKRMRAALLLIKNGSDGDGPALNVDEIVDAALSEPTTRERRAE